MAHGDKRVALMTQAALQNIINKKTPAGALNFRKAMRGFLDHCLSLNFIKADPLASVKLVEVKLPVTTHGHPRNAGSLRHTIKSERVSVLPTNCCCRQVSPVAMWCEWAGSTSATA